MASEILGDSNLYACFKDYLGNIVIVSNVRNVLGWTDACCKISLNVELYTDTLVLFEQGVIYDIMNVTSEYKNLCLKIKEKYSYTPVINSIVNYIERNCNIKDLSLEKTASLFRMSPSYMSKLLKSEIGNSFINILTKMRVQRAAALIGNSQIKMYEVAELVGYSNQYYFSRAFKKVMGLSPVQYKGGRTN
jgi:two-component system response regulator YesN